MSEKPYGEILDEMDHQAKYQSATIDPRQSREAIAQIIDPGPFWRTIPDVIWARADNDRKKVALAKADKILALGAAQQPEVQSEEAKLSRREHAEMIWAVLKSYMLDECSLECASIGPSDEKHILNELFNLIPDSAPLAQASPDAIKRAMAFAIGSVSGPTTDEEISDMWRMINEAYTEYTSLPSAEGE